MFHRHERVTNTFVQLLKTAIYKSYYKAIYEANTLVVQLLKSIVIKTENILVTAVKNNCHGV